MEEGDRKMKKLLKALTDLIRGLGTVLLASPLFLYWFIHGDNERYMWIINGPEPFGSLGGGPFQLWIGAVLFILGFAMIFASGIIERHMN